MPSLWTDDDRGAHPWVAARPHAAAPPAPASALGDDEPVERPLHRARALAVACAAAAVAGALFEVLR